MTEQRIHHDWLRHPAASAVMKLSQLPSLSLHSSQASILLPPLMLVCYQEMQFSDSTCCLRPAVFHRHLSRWLVCSQQLLPILDLTDPALPLAALPAPVFEKLILYIGLSMLACSLRKTIARDEVSHLRQILGASALDFSINCDVAQAQGSQMIAIDLARLPEQAIGLGSAILSAVFRQSSAAVGKRGILRLPIQETDLQISNSVQPLVLALSALNFLDSKWLSSFPTIL
jgi:hypothetical protein